MNKVEYRCPSVAVDLIIQCAKSDVESGLVLIERKNPPYGYALPGGFVDYGESTYDAAIREAKEETGLDVILTRQLFTYSHPSRDTRQHVISIAYVANANGEPIAADDAKSIVWVNTNNLESWLKENKGKLVCDHYFLLKDYIHMLPYSLIYNIDPEVERNRWEDKI